MSLAHLSPRPLWQHFQRLCEIPRPSGHEQALRAQLVAWASDRGFTSEQDEAGNLLIRKPATPGYEDRCPVILQGHLDMVSQKRKHSPHCFETDPIQVREVEGWVMATDTTLGADNGMGVAAALAVLECDDLPHGPLEALFTIEEESSMRGALELRPHWLRGSVLLNLDSEDRGDVYVGCAGGVDINVSAEWSLQTLNPNEWAIHRLDLGGLRGGHSGLDIDKGRGNAIRLTARLVEAVCRLTDCRVIQFDGGSLRNALPRESSVIFSVASAFVPKLAQEVDLLAGLIQEEMASVEPGLTIQLSPLNLASEGGELHLQALSRDDTRRFIHLLLAAPHGVERMSPEFHQVVATSNNLGVIKLSGGRLQGCLLARALRASELRALAARIRAVFELAGCQVSLDNGYPGWTPDPESPALRLFQTVHEQTFGEPAQVKVIHAGLECGIIGANYPLLDMVSFGPIIRGAHSPDERVEIASVEAFWRLLRNMIAALSEWPATS
ncbi:MAG: aminoacyl-histidine dipeptidase [Hahellaceae bacterium]|nr:aminoacyl-histidine dipeptidase [Hahellaceae bacterium]